VAFFQQFNFALFHGQIQDFFRLSGGRADQYRIAGQNTDINNLP
jgi:hypothetical protein